MNIQKPKAHISKFETKALCHTCHTSNVTCTPHPKTNMPECASCKDKRENPHPAPAMETSLA